MVVWSCRRRSAKFASRSLVGALFLSLLAACSTSSDRDDSAPGDGGTEYGNGGTTTALATAEEGLDSPRPVVALSDGELTAAIGEGTRRSARGLPVELRGYPSWPRLTADDTRAEFVGGLGGARIYAQTAPETIWDPGDALEKHLEDGFTVAIERASDRGDFVARVDTLRRTGEGWEVRAFGRAGDDGEFEELPEASAGAASFTARLGEELATHATAWKLVD